MILDRETVELLADELAARLDEREAARSGWVSAEAVARHLSVEVSYVYAHASKLGAVRLGEGPKARLRFRLADVDACRRSRSTREPGIGAVEPKPPRRRRRSMGTTPPLLPIRGPRTSR